MISDKENPFVVDEFEMVAFVVRRGLLRIPCVRFLDYPMAINLYLESALPLFLQSHDLLVHEIRQPPLSNTPNLGHIRLPRLLKVFNLRKRAFCL